jgi:hypothetical protein
MDSTSTYGAVIGVVTVSNSAKAFETKVVDVNGIFTIV